MGLKTTQYPTKTEAQREITDSRREKTLEAFTVPLLVPAVRVELPDGISKVSQSQPTE